MRLHRVVFLTGKEEDDMLEAGPFPTQRPMNLANIVMTKRTDKDVSLLETSVFLL